MFRKRLQTLQKSLDRNNIHALVVSSPVNIHYLTGYPNFSRIEREAYLFVTGKHAMLFTDGRYIEAVERTVHPNIKATIKPTLKTINQIVSAKGGSASGRKRIGFEKNFTFEEYERFRKEINAKFILTETLVEKLREIKDAGEISSMKKAAELTDKCFKSIQTSIKLNVSEREIAHRIEMFIKAHGGEIAFETIVAFGPNSSVPHHITSSKKLVATDEFIKLDFGAKVDGYCCDMTRTLLTKRASDKARKMYQTVLDAQTAGIDYINNAKKPVGVTAYGIADKVITKNDFPAIPHGLGHGIGLEIHEAPTLSPKAKDDLLDNMVFSVEPGIYIPGFGGVRIEDTVLFRNNKIELLTHSPKTLDSNYGSFVV